MQHLHGEASVPHTWDTCKQQEKNNNKNIGHRLEHKRSDYFQGTKQIILNKMVFDMKWDIKMWFGFLNDSQKEKT